MFRVGLIPFPKQTRGSHHPDLCKITSCLVQAQTAAAQEQEAARAAKVRKEQLALRQSKQLVPVMSTSKAKHPGSNLAPDRPHLTSLRKPSGRHF